MRILRTTLVVMLALLWAPMASHCLLESSLSLTSLSCCGHQDVAGPHENDCHSDACDTVESAQYKTAQQRLTVPLPKLQLHFETAPLASATFEPVVGLFPEHPSAPPNLSSAWRFTCRAALPPRAPSLV